VVSFTPEEHPRYPLNRRLGGTQSRSRQFGEEKTPLPLLRIESRYYSSVIIVICIIIIFIIALIIIIIIISSQREIITIAANSKTEQGMPRFPDISNLRAYVATSIRRNECKNVKTERGLFYLTTLSISSFSL
jgi:hypothetical protein